MRLPGGLPPLGVDMELENIVANTVLLKAREGKDGAVTAAAAPPGTGPAQPRAGRALWSGRRGSNLGVQVGSGSPEPHEEASARKLLQHRPESL